MPPTPRTTRTRATRPTRSQAGVAGDAPEPPSAARETTRAAALAAEDAGGDLIHAVGHVVALPLTVARELTGDVASTLRRPDAVAYVGGVVGLAALGVLEWPVAAVAGVGLAVANGVRRRRG